MVSPPIGVILSLGNGLSPISSLLSLLPSQLFRREIQSSMQWLQQNTKHLFLHPSMRALQRPTAKGEQGGKEESKRPPNLILLCLELLLPVSDHLLRPEDRDLVDEYRKKIGKVWRDLGPDKAN